MLSTGITIALAYWAAGLLALALAIPPGYTAPFFPSAGIALAALIIFGLRYWPAVFMGSALVQLAAAWPLIGTAGWSPLGPMIVPVGATLQAVAGAALARRLISFPSALDTPGSVLRLLAIAVPVSALVSCTIAVSALVWAGVIPPAGALFNWWSWWAGDTLGALIATPLMFVFFGRPVNQWRPRRLAVAVPLALALVLLTLAYRQVVQWEEMRIHAQFDRDATHLSGLLQKRLDRHIEMMRSIERLFSVSENVTAADFTAFVTPWMERHSGTQSFSWNPLVLDGERDAFEASVRASGLPGFTLRDRDAEGRTTTAGRRAEYLPVAYIAPTGINDSAIGMDPLSFPVAAEAIARTRSDGQPAASGRMRLVQETSDQQGVAVYLGVFAPGTAGSSQRLRGVVTATFRLDDVLTAALQGSPSTHIERCLIERDTAAPTTCLAGTRPNNDSGWDKNTLVHTAPISFAGRQWELRLRASPEYMRQLQSWAAWATVAVGLLATAMLGALLLITTGTNRRINALVEQRTAELEAASADLNEKQAALIDAQRIARMGSWETVSGNPDLHAPGLHTSAELHLLLGVDGSRLERLGDLVEAVSPTSRQALASAFERAAQNPGRTMLDCKTDTLPPRTLQFRIESVWQDGVLARIRGTAQDVSSAREAEAKIQFLARYDTLTGLHNRSAWQEQARIALCSAARHQDKFAVLFLDLDNFKTVNDSLGHAAGDRMLALTASRLSRCLRDEDLLARIGGDEFVALLSRLSNLEEAALVADRMLAALTEPMNIDGHELHLSASIGIALYPSDGAEVDTLLKHADTAMYSAKEAGRNTYRFFIPEMNARATERLLMEADLRRALERNELILHYQPQIEAATGRPYGCEALVRWIHPQRGLVPPDHFIPLAEETGLIAPLGEWVLRTACQQQVEWRAAGLPDLIVAVNISALQFRKRDFVQMVARMLTETGADPACIELEITESALMEPSTELTDRLQDLVDLGLTLALDDFGTGYSSLSYLKRMPIARLKIDRSFVDDLPGNAEDAAVTSAALSLARDLGMQVVAEGVETQVQRDYLAERGCHAMQGYLFSRPLTVDAFANWIRANPRI
jgi:diguanylate cyclase (GGDEF)-like protein